MLSANSPLILATPFLSYVRLRGVPRPHLRFQAKDALHWRLWTSCGACQPDQASLRMLISPAISTFVFRKLVVFYIHAQSAIKVTCIRWRRHDLRRLTTPLRRLWTPQLVSRRPTPSSLAHRRPRLFAAAQCSKNAIVTRTS